MAFFVVQRDADSALSIPLPDAYPTREAAIAALSAATASGALVLRGEVFIADLSTAVPVLVMQAAPAPVVPEAAAPAEEEPGLLDELEADALYAPPLLGDEQSLAAALKRAATSLEEEGIIAPASVESDPSDAGDAEDLVAEIGGESAAGGERPWEWANVEAYEAPADVAVEASAVETGSAAEVETADEAEADAEIASEPLEEMAEEPAAVPFEEPVLEDADAPALEDSSPETTEAGETALDEALAELEAPADEEATSSYVEAPVFESAEAPVAEPETEPLAGEDDLAASLDSELHELTGAAIGDPVADESPIITSAPADGEDAYVPRPVILGDYADVVVPGGLEIEELDEAVTEPAAAEPTIADPVDAPGAMMADLVETGYEATGELDLAGYTCQDCVYSNTCPKVGQASPADCGSFQWRSE